MSSSRLPCDPHPKKTKKPWASAAAARLLLLRGGKAAAKDESIEFFSDLRLRECHPDPRISGQTGRGPADRKGKAARRSAGDSGELLVSAEIGKHDYDWLLTPPATRTSSPAAALNRLARPTSASHAKSNSPLSLTRRQTSRLARSSSAPNTPALALAPASSPGSGRPSHARTLSSSPGSSTSTLPPGPAATGPRKPDIKDSKAGRRPSKVNQGWTSSSSRPRASTTGAESTRVTSGTEQRPAPAPAMARRGANAVARSRFAATGSTSTGQTARNASRPSSSIKPRPVPVPRRSTAGLGASRKPANSAAGASVDAFPSTRYDAMLLREDPKNLTWLNGCGDDDAGFVEGSLEPFHVLAGVLN